MSIFFANSRALTWLDTKRRHWPSVGVGVVLMALALPTHAQRLPLWELGVGLGGLSLPYYRGADARENYLIPFPYFQYRGEYVRVDRDGARGLLFRQDHLRLDLSISGGIPVPSDDSPARENMPDLDPTVEFGPSVEARLWRSSSRDQAIWLKLPVRAVFAASLWEVDHTGWVSSPYVEWQARRGTTNDLWEVGVALGPVFGDRNYHRYFYEVKSAFATPSRREYHPDPGYSGSRVTLTFERRFSQRLWLGAFARYDTLAGAAFEDSPLVRDSSYLAFGIAIVQMLSASERLTGPP